MEDHELKRQEPPRIWDNTMRTMYNECPRKLYFFLRRFTYEKQDLPIYFTWGRAFHQGLLSWYTSGIANYALRIADMVAEAEKLWRDEGAVDKPPTDTIANLRAKLKGYAEYYGEEEEWHFTPKGAEAGWLWPLSDKWELAGAMDGYVSWPGKGMFTLEHKTTGGYLIQNYREQWHFSTQVTGYIWYLHQILPKEDVYGAIINMVTKNIKGPRSRWNYPEYDRELIRKLPWQLEKFQEDFLYDLTRFERSWNDWHWPQLGMCYPANCSGGPGKSPCLFRSICLTPVALEDIDIRRYMGIIETDDKWEPWARKGEA